MMRKTHSASGAAIQIDLVLRGDVSWANMVKLETGQVQAPGGSRSRVLATTFLMITLIMNHARPARAIQEDSGGQLDARVFFEKNRDRVRALIERDPNEAGVRLVYDIVRPMGDDPRVLEFCEDLIAHGTNPAAAEVVLGATRSIVLYYGDEIKNAKRVPIVLRIVDIGLQNPSVGVRLAAAEVIKVLGPRYDARLQSAYVEVFAAEVAPTVDDGARKDMVRVIRGLLQRSKSDRKIRSLIRTATEKYNLLAFFRSRIDVPQQPGTQAERMNDFEAWQLIMWSKK